MLELPWNLLGGQPRIRLPDGRIISKPHAEWYLHHLRWRWLIDSWEGGEVYRMATYGYDIHGMPVRNLIRHKHEYPSIYDQTYSPQTGRPPGTDPASQSTDDDYELRRARTPVPGFLAEVIETHLSKIYAREIDRQGPKDLTAWWLNVDGRGTTIDQWMAETVAPLLLCCGCLDIVLDHPRKPEGVEVRSKADELSLGLDAVVASYILPENLVWWDLGTQGEYRECLVREVQDDQSIIWRYWTKELWATYDRSGQQVGEPFPHGYGAIPIVRLFDRRRPRMKNIGLPRYELIAELQREYYNRDSELVLSDSTQSFPLLQGPDDYVSADGTIPVGPNWLLPMKGNAAGSGKTYQGFAYIDPPKGAAESLRANKADMRDSVDRHACLTKPAGAAGTSANSVSQSGVSKQLDATTGNDLLSKIAKMLGRNEIVIGRLALLVLHNGKDTTDPGAVQVTYPSEFDLMSAGEIADLLGKIQMLVNSAGAAPTTEGIAFGKLIRQAFRGLTDDKYQAMDDELASVLSAASQPPPVQMMLGQGRQPEGTVSNPQDPSTTPQARAALQAALSDLTRSPAEQLG